MAMQAKQSWVIYFVGFDEEGEVPTNSYIEPFVAKEWVSLPANAGMAMEEAQMLALVRGGELLAVVKDTESAAETIRKEIEATLLRVR